MKFDPTNKQKKLAVDLKKSPSKVLNEYDFNLHVSNKHTTVKEKVPIDVRILTEVIPGPSMMPAHSLAQNHSGPPPSHLDVRPFANHQLLRSSSSSSFLFMDNV